MNQPNPSAGFAKRLALMVLGAMSSNGTKSTGALCSTARYYGKTFDRLQNPKKRTSKQKKKFFRQRKNK